MREFGRAAWHALRSDGTLWLNLGDCYAGGYNAKSVGGKHFGKVNPVAEAGAYPMSGPNRTIVKRVSKPGLEGCGRNQSHALRADEAGRQTPDLKPKDLVGMPWRVAFALQADGWWLRSDIIWAKSNGLPESVKDRATHSHEYLFLLAKAKRYYYDHVAVREPGSDVERRRWSKPRTSEQPDQYTLKRDAEKSIKRAGKTSCLRSAEARVKVATAGTRNRRSVWRVATVPYKGAHFAVFPPKLIEPCILAGSPRGGVVCDPFAGAGTTGLVAARLHREFIGFDVNGGDADLGGHTANQRIAAARAGLPLKEYLAGQGSIVEEA